MSLPRRTCVCILILVLGLAAFAQNQPPKSTEAKSASDVSGEWQGKITNLRLVLNINKTDDGAFSGGLKSLDQGNVTIPIQTVSFQQSSGTLRLELKLIGAVYEGKLNDDGSEIAGSWQQGGNSTALVFRRPGAAAKTTLKP